MKKLQINFTCGNQYQLEQTIAVIAEYYRKEGSLWNHENLQLFRAGGYGFQIFVEYLGENPVDEVIEILDLLRPNLFTRYKKEEFDSPQQFSTARTKATVLRTI